MKDELILECTGCQAIYEPDPQRTQINLYDYPFYNHMLTICPACDIRQLLFFSSPLMLQLDFKQVKRHKPSPEVKRVYAAVKGLDEDTTEIDTEEVVKAVEFYDLTYGQKRRVREFSEMLQSLSTEWFWEIFSNPPPKSKLPLLWPDRRKR